MIERIGYGRLESPLPYPVQEDYDRSLREVELPACVLDNGVLRATVLPTLGGRVWSLYDAVRGRELLFCNPVLQFANFGLTNAWFAGGIEWNLGSTGHTTLTCRPMHAGVVAGPDGDVLRLWEWERTRDLVLQVDLSLPSGSDRLYASTRVINPDPEDEAALLLDQHRGARDARDTRADRGGRGLAHGVHRRPDPGPRPAPGPRGRRHQPPDGLHAPRRLLLRGGGTTRTAHRGRRARRAWLRADVDARAARPKAVPVGQRSGRFAVAGVALRPGREVRRDPGGTVPDPARARSTGWWVERVVDRGLRRHRPGPGSSCGRIRRGVCGRPRSRARSDGSRPPRRLPRTLAEGGGRRRSRRAGEPRLGLGSCRAPPSRRDRRGADRSPAVPTRGRRQPPGTPPARW